MQNRARGRYGVGALEDEGVGVSVARTNSGDSIIERDSRKSRRHGAGCECADEAVEDILALAVRG